LDNLDSLDDLDRDRNDGKLDVLGGLAVQIRAGIPDICISPGREEVGE
jgi:hypothetical protein